MTVDSERVCLATVKGTGTREFGTKEFDSIEVSESAGIGFWSQTDKKANAADQPDEPQQPSASLIRSFHIQFHTPTFPCPKFACPNRFA